MDVVLSVYCHTEDGTTLSRQPTPYKLVNINISHTNIATVEDFLLSYSTNLVISLLSLAYLFKRTPDVYDLQKSSPWYIQKCLRKVANTCGINITQSDVCDNCFHKELLNSCEISCPNKRGLCSNFVKI